MGAFAYFKGIRANTGELHQNMVAVKRACVKAKVEFPNEVSKYFDNLTLIDAEYVDEDGPLMVDLKHVESSDSNSASTTYDILVKDIPEGVEKIRFVISY